MILCFCRKQEANKREDRLEKKLGRNGIFSYFKSDARGCGIVVGSKITIIKKFEPCVEGRIAACVVEINGMKVGLISVYCPNVGSSLKDKEKYTRTLISLEHYLDLVSQESKNILLAGDFNLIMDSQADSVKESSIHLELVQQIEEIKLKFGLLDSFRVVNGDVSAFTFAPKGENKRNIFKRLDYVYVSEGFSCLLKEVFHRDCYFSDHKAVHVKISSQASQQSTRNFWRHNDSLLQDPDYCKVVVECIEKAKEEGSELGKQALWDFVKYKVRQCCMNEAKIIKARKADELSSLYESLNELEKNLIQNKLEILKVKEKIFLLEWEKNKSIIFRSQVKDYEENEKPTRYFFNKIKEFGNDSNIIELKDNNGNFLSKTEINYEIFNFYSKIFGNPSVSQIAENTDLLNLLPKIPEEKIPNLECEVTEKEIETILFKKLNDGKSPGNDGLTVKFYKTFWKNIKSLVSGSILEGIKLGNLSASQKQSIIRLIRKKDKVKENLANWRPISLMNVDAKIFSRLISARFENVIESLLSPEQLAYISSRNIADGIRLIDYIISFCKDRKQEGLLLALDFQKAFDSIEHNFLFAVLKRFGFPEKLLWLVKTLYKDAESAVMNNGLTTKYFPLLKSCRQGDCLSPYLFILCLEPLIRNIKANVSCKGINVQGKSFKLSVYADDITAFVKTEADGEILINMVEDFGKLSGLKLNLNKSEIFQLGNGSFTPITSPKMSKLKLSPEIKITGVTFSNDRNKMDVLNFSKPLSTMNRLATQFRARDLSYIGKALVLKANLLSQIQFLANVVEVPDWVIRSGDKILFKFLWGGVDKISRARAACNMSLGGLGIPSIKDVALKAAVKWLVRSVQKEELPWVTFLQQDLDKIGGLCGIASIRTPCDSVKLGLGEFNMYLFNAWNQLKEMNSEKRNTCNSVVWWNRQLQTKVKGKKSILEGARLIRQGYCRISDFVDHNGRIKEAIGSLGVLEKLEWLSVQNRLRSLKLIKCLGPLSSTLDNNFSPIKQMISLNGIDLDCLRPSDLKVVIRKHKQNLSIIKPCKLFQKYEIGPEELLERFSLIKKITISSKFRNFIWRFLNGIIYSNHDKYKFGYIHDSQCHQCGAEDTLQHMLLDCKVVEQLRAQVYTRFGRSFTAKQALIGTTNVVEDIILWKLNQYIYNSAIAQQKLAIQDFFGYVRMCFLVEEDIAARKGKLSIHVSKWNDLSNFTSLKDN